MRRVALSAFGLIASSLLTGCAGRGTLQIIPLQTKDIDERRPLVWRFDAGQCYWWLDQAGTVNVAMQYENVSLLGEWGKVRIAASLSLDEPPAGAARTYKVRGRGLRAGAQFGPDHRRFRSYLGVASIRRVGKDRLRGRFRIYTLQQRFSVLDGWRLAGAYLFLGEFDAVAEEQKGRAIMQASEVDDWARALSKPTTLPTRPASRPTTRPTSTPTTQLRGGRRTACPRAGGSYFPAGCTRLVFDRSAGVETLVGQELRAQVPVGEEPFDTVLGGQVGEGVRLAGQAPHVE